MRRIIALALLGLIASLFVIPARAGPFGTAPLSGQTTFFDDFTGSGFPTRWSFIPIGTVGAAYQDGGYLTLSNQPGHGTILVANLTGQPAFGSILSGGIQFEQIVFKTQPFNISSFITNQNVALVDEIGLVNNITSASASNVIFLSLLQSGSQTLKNMNLGFTCNLPNAKQAIIMNVFKPTSGAANTFESVGGCGTNPGILYNSGNGFIDLGQQHIFTIQVQVDLSNSTNTWIAWQVDNNGWMVLSQTACTCITSSSPIDIAPLFPFIYSSFTFPASGSLGTIASATDYVLMTNYIPTSLPQGQLISCAVFSACAAIAPTVPQPTISGGTASLSSFFQFEANSIDHGNIYAGGMMLIGIILLPMTIVMGISARKAGIGIGRFMFGYTLLCLGLSVFGFMMGILPIWIPIGLVTVVLAELGGVIRLHNESGGEVSP